MSPIGQCTVSFMIGYAVMANTVCAANTHTKGKEHKAHRPASARAREPLDGAKKKKMPKERRRAARTDAAEVQHMLGKLDRPAIL